MRALVLWVEPDHSTATLYARPGGERMRQLIAATAMIEFELGESGLCSRIKLHSVDQRMAGEYAMIRAVERRLIELDRVGGRLVTFGGAHDLSLIRLGALRHRHFPLGGAAAWLRDIRDAHDDVSEMMDPTGKARAQVGDFLSGLCGGRPATDKQAGPRRRERVIAEFEAVRTLIAYLYLLSEQQQGIEPLAAGVMAIADMIWGRFGSLQHLLPMLDTELFETFAPVPF